MMVIRDHIFCQVHTLTRIHASLKLKPFQKLFHLAVCSTVLNVFFINIPTSILKKYVMKPLTT